MGVHMSGVRLVLSVVPLLCGVGALCMTPVNCQAAAEQHPMHITVAQNDGQTQVDPLYFARWNINYGEFLIDVGKYLEALEAFQTAIEATTNPQVRAEAHLHRASTLAIFLDAFDDAVREYERILSDYPQTPLAETARFRLGMLLFDQQRYREAASQFEVYLHQYPQGRSASSAEFLLSKSRQALEERPPPPSPPPPVMRPHVRVRLVAGTREVVMRSSGPISVLSTAGQQVYHGQGQVTLRPASSDILVGERHSSLRELRITAPTPITLTQKSLRCYRRAPATPGLYRGVLRVFLHDDKLLVVNEVDIEKYLYGVLPVEVPSSWPSEALKAQAIAARTYAIYQFRHRSNESYDLVDTAGDQVYRGKQCEATHTTQAVNATQGMILVHERRPILAMYTSNTGWHSASSRHIFDQPLPYLVGVQDPYSPGQPMGHWRRIHQAGEIRRQLARIGIHVGAVQDLRPQEVTPSGRIKKVTLVSNHGIRMLRARTTLRRALDLPEVLLRITRHHQTFIFDGGGFGHGVGLSQWGAKDMATKGKSAQDILHFYYHDIRLEKEW